MKSAKLLFIDKVGNETLVATFKNVNEAMQCRDLLQAKCADQDDSYYSVDYYDKERKCLRRSMADSFAKQVLYMAESVQQNIRIMLS
jgi:hypothetical protein